MSASSLWAGSDRNQPKHEMYNLKSKHFLCVCQNDYFDHTFSLLKNRLLKDSCRSFIGSAGSLKTSVVIFGMKPLIGSQPRGSGSENLYWP